LSRERLDAVLVKRGFFDARSRAASEVMSGRVLVNGEKCEKPGTRISDDVDITVLSSSNPYVSRGGLKLAGAHRDLGFSFKEKVVLDTGASTGGFTHYALEQGAAKVYAVDVGYGQLDWSLRNDQRVINLERTNARYLREEDLQERPDMAIIDVSFISLEKIIPVVQEIAVSEIIALVKPQFEAGKEMVGRKGVVREAEVHRQVLQRLIIFAGERGYFLRGITFSRLQGPRGNIEYFIYLDYDYEGGKSDSKDGLTEKEAADRVVREAWSFFT